MEFSQESAEGGGSGTGLDPQGSGCRAIFAPDTCAPITTLLASSSAGGREQSGLHTLVPLVRDGCDAHIPGCLGAWLLFWWRMGVGVSLKVLGFSWLT